MDASASTPAAAAEQAKAENGAIRPFSVEIPEEKLAELRDRIAATSWPQKELVDDASQGVQSPMMQALTRYWGTDYDWHKCEAELNALPQFKTEVDGLDIHFIHVKSSHEDALPLILTHGWPGSVIEMLGVVGPLTDPTAHGGRAEDAFDLVVPSLPGYGFSDEPTEVGWDQNRTAKAWRAMNRLGYTRYVAQGGDQGALVTDAMARLAPDGLSAFTSTSSALSRPTCWRRIFGAGPVPGLGKRLAVSVLAAHAESKEEATLEAVIKAFTQRATSSRCPSTRRRSASAWRIRRPGWRPGCSTTTLTATRRSRAPSSTGNPRRPTWDSVLDNITLYWLTNTATSAARIYWEEGRTTAAAVAAGKKPPKLELPVGFTVFPGEIFQTPRSWAEQRFYPNLIYFNEADKEGHFAAWEEPEVFSAELLRAAFSSVR